MNRSFSALLVAFLLLAHAFTGALAQAPSGGAPIAANPGYGPSNASGLTVASTPVLGVCTTGYVLYNNNGVLGCQSAGAYTLPAATAVTLGGVKPDGTTITNSSGAISVSGANLTGYLASNLANGALPAGVTVNNGNWSGTVLSVANGGTGTASPGLVAGTNITSITGTWPNQTINASGGGGAVSSVSNSDSTLTVTPTTGSVVASLNLGHANTWTATQTFPSPAFTGTVTGAGTIPVGVISATGSASSTTYLRGDGSWQTPAGGSISFPQTIAGTTNSGGIPYFSSATVLSSSAALAANALVVGGGAGVAPSTATTNSTVLTAIGNAPNAANGLLTYSIIGASGATVPLLNAANTYSGASSFTSTTAFSGAAVSSAGNTTTIFGGTAAPTYSNAGYLAVGGNYTAGSVATAGAGGVSLSAANGLQLQSYGTTYDGAIVNKSGNVAAAVPTGTTNFRVNGAVIAPTWQNSVNQHLFGSGTLPTLGTGGGTLGTVNGTFYVSFTASSGGGAQIVNLPAAITDWTCELHDRTSGATIVVVQSNTTASTNSATFTPYSRTTGLSTTWPGTDLVTGTCWAG